MAAKLLSADYFVDVLFSSKPSENLSCWFRRVHCLLLLLNSLILFLVRLSACSQKLPGGRLWVGSFALHFHSELWLIFTGIHFVSSGIQWKWLREKRKRKYGCQKLIFPVEGFRCLPGRGGLRPCEVFLQKSIKKIFFTEVYRIIIGIK